MKYSRDLNTIIEVKSDWTFKQSLSKLKEIGSNAFTLGYMYLIFAIKKLSPNRLLSNDDKNSLENVLNMLISSQAQSIEKVQRLSLGREYRPIAFGSGSTVAPVDEFCVLSECDIVYSAQKCVAGA